MKIVVDVMASDNGPIEIIKGCVEAVKENNKVEVAIVGDANIINAELKNHKFNLSQIEVINASEVITNEDHPVSAIRSKADSSIVVAFTNLRDRADLGAYIGAGSTGAVITAASLKLGRVRGVIRPTLCSIFPTAKKGKVLFADSGANVDSKPEMLVQYAILASEFAKSHLKLEAPRVGLLNVGVEEGKGNELTKATYPLLKELKNINFIGNVEAREFLSGDVDVIVCDAFAGNVMMKSVEGAGKLFKILLGEAIKKNIFTKIRASLIAGRIKKSLGVLDYKNYGGAYVLGCDKIICKCHGSSRFKSIKLAILETYDLINSNVTENIKKLKLAD